MTSPSFGWVVLYRDSELALRRPVKTPDAVPEIADFWRKAVAGDTDGLAIAEPSRRRIPDRRRSGRAGRRSEDRSRRE
jgi:hypothetical protein